jgi:uncharacterized protein involved in exopolysaccharide biosynthesis
MKMNNSRHRGSWIIGGTTLIGLGIGLILLERSALWFVAAVLVGIGAGVLLAAFFPAENE